MLIQCLSGRLKESFTFYSFFCFIRTYVLCFIKQCIDTQSQNETGAHVFLQHFRRRARQQGEQVFRFAEDGGLFLECRMFIVQTRTVTSKTRGLFTQKLLCYDSAKAFSSTRVSSGLTGQIQEDNLILLVYNKIKKNHGIQSMTGLGMSQVSRSEVP